MNSAKHRQPLKMTLLIFDRHKYEVAVPQDKREGCRVPGLINKLNTSRIVSVVYSKPLSTLSRPAPVACTRGDSTNCSCFQQDHAQYHYVIATQEKNNIIAFLTLILNVVLTFVLQHLNGKNFIFYMD